MHKTVYAVLIITVFGWSNIATANITDGWTAVYASDAVNDTGNGGHPYLDIVGGTDANGLEFAGGYLRYRSASSNPQLNEDELSFRFRLDGIKPRMTGAYQVYFETTGDSSVDWALQLTTSDLGSGGTLAFGHASGMDRNGAVCSSIDWTGAYADYVDFTGTSTADGSEFNHNPDYFLDLSMPWQQFSSLTGISSPSSGKIRVVMATSQKEGSIKSGDIAGTSSSGNVSFNQEFAAIPEPAVATLVGGFGLALLMGRRIFRRD